MLLLVIQNSSVGSASKPIYLNAGTATACNIDLSTFTPKASPALTGSPQLLHKELLIIVQEK